jgi:hypothetical protein
MQRHGLITINEVPTYLMYLSLPRYPLPELDLSQSHIALLDLRIYWQKQYNWPNLVI